MHYRNRYYNMYPVYRLTIEKAIVYLNEENTFCDKKLFLLDYNEFLRIKMRALSN